MTIKDNLEKLKTLIGFIKRDSIYEEAYKIIEELEQKLDRFEKSEKRKNFSIDLLKLMLENPDTPIMFFSYNDNIYEDDSYTAYTDFYVDIEELALDDGVYLEYDDIVEKYNDVFYNKPGYKDLSDDEFDKAIEDYINKNCIFEKYICVWGRE